MSDELPVEDAVSRAARSGQASEEGRERGELIGHGIKSIDGITFANVKMKFSGDRTRSGHEVILEDGDRELRFMSLLNESGELTSAVEVVSGKRREEENLEAHVKLYLLTDEKLTKVLDGKYRGKFKEFDTYDEYIDFVQQRRQMGMRYEKVEE